MGKKDCLLRIKDNLDPSKQQKKIAKTMFLNSLKTIKKDMISPDYKPTDHGRRCRGNLQM